MTQQFNVPSRLLSLGAVTLFGLGSIGFISQSAQAQNNNNNTNSISEQEINRNTPFLTFGATGNDVEEVQRYLQQEGYYNSEVDGIYGVQTESAVREYQADNNLGIDGIVGSETWSALSEINVDNNGLSRNEQNQMNPGIQNQGINDNNRDLDNNSRFDNNNNMNPGMNNNNNLNPGMNNNNNSGEINR